MRLLLVFALLIYSVNLISQDLELENEILKANQICSLRFEADSIKTYYFNVDADRINDLIEYERNELKLIDKLIAMSREGSLAFYKANSLNHFIGSPMTYREFQNQLSFNDGYQSGLHIENYIFRIEEYYFKGISDKKQLLVIGPLTKNNSKTQVLFWVHLYELYDEKIIQKMNTKDCTETQKFYQNIDY